MKYNELLRSGKEELEKAGIDEAESDARILFEFVTGMDRSNLLSKGDTMDVTIRENHQFKLYIEKRKQHEPVQYITGEADFMGLKFIVDRTVLIPRLDTEFLVEEMMKTVEDGAKVLDLCTGSGCILLSIMKYKNDIKGTGTDISEQALKVAEANENLIFGKTGSGTVHWIQSDMFEKVEGTFDVIVSNPPYIRTGDLEGLMSEVKDHEPVSALDGGEDGLDYYRIIAEGARDHLTKEGRLFLEIGYDQRAAVTEILGAAGYRDIEVISDYSGNDRVAVCRI